ncbi:MAG: hypothetical protein E7262_09715 [Lachnospiraceae bacterium]|nr:hypothetical protein [Lachnospiraceae bacterium]
MRATYHIFYNNESNLDYKCSIISRPNIPTPVKDIEAIKIEGRDGELHKDKGTYGDIEITVDFNFACNPDEFTDKLRKIRTWLFGKEDKKLIMSDDPEFYYNVKTVTMSDVKRKIKRKGEFSVVFKVEPYSYRSDGLIEKEITSETLYNPYEFTYPVYRITGNGECMLNINGKSVVATIEDELTILSQARLCYDKQNNIANSSIAGEYDSLILQNGFNDISVSEGFVLNITPNWRTI